MSNHHPRAAITMPSRSARAPRMRRSSRAMRSERGLSLIELMVGLAIGMLATLLMFQTVTVSERVKRTTASGNEGMRTGALMMDYFGYLARAAGGGLVQAPGSFGCLINARFNNVQRLPAVGGFPSPFDGVPPNLRLAPVMVFDGGKGPDVLMVAMGSSSSGNVPISNATVDITGLTMSVNNPMGLRQGEAFLLTRFSMPANVPTSADCFVAQVNASATQVDLNGYVQSPMTISPGGGYTGAPPVNTQFDAAPLGRDPRFLLIGVLRDSNGRSSLVSYDLLQGGQPQIIAENVVDFQVMYGLDTDPSAGSLYTSQTYFGDGVVDLWQEATGDWSADSLQSVVPGGAGGMVGAERMRRIKAVRIALVTVDTEMQRDEVLRSSPTLTIFASTPAQFDRSLGEFSSDWKNSRYQLFEGVFPVRNLSSGLSPVLGALVRP